MSSRKMWQVKKWPALLVLMGLLAGCESTPQVSQAIRDDLDQTIAAKEQRQQIPEQPEPPAEVMDELLPLGKGQQSDLAQALLSEKRFQLSANDVDARVFFNSLVADTPYSIAVHPEVAGKISLSLQDVTLEEVFAVVTDIYGYDVRKNGNIYQVFPSGIRTQTYSLNYLFMTREGKSRTSIASGRVSDDRGGNGSNTVAGDDPGSSSSDNSNGRSGMNGTLISTDSKSEFWTELDILLNAMVGQDAGRRVVISPQSGLVSVRAMPDELRQVEAYLQRLERRLLRQVLLEAKIVEVTLSDGYQQGIEWQDIAFNQGSTDFNFSTTPAILGNTITNTLGGIASLTFTNEDFSGVISLLKSQGNVNVLSSPRLSAANNQKAVIKVGTDEYFVTDISTTTVTGTATSTTPDIELTPFFSGVSLDVTPQIDDQEGILLHVHPSIIDVQEQVKSIVVDNSTVELPLAQSDIRETDTVIKANSGDVVVIGGLMSSRARNSYSKTPILGDIPFVGELFTNKSEEEIKTELVILIKPTIVAADTWVEYLRQSRSRLDEWNMPKPSSLTF